MEDHVSVLDTVGAVPFSMFQTQGDRTFNSETQITEISRMQSRLSGRIFCGKTSSIQ